jgi:hypothetical protein
VKRKKRNLFVDDEVEVDDASDEVCGHAGRCGWEAGARAVPGDASNLTSPDPVQDGEEEGDDGIVDDEAEVEAAAQEQAGRLHARVEAERAAGNKMTDEQLEAYVRERWVSQPLDGCMPRASVRAETGLA